MAIGLKDAVDCLVKLQDLVLELLQPPRLLLGGIDDLDLLLLEPGLLHDLEQHRWVDPPVWKLTVEHGTAHLGIQGGPLPQHLTIYQVAELLGRKVLLRYLSSSLRRYAVRVALRRNQVAVVVAILCIRLEELLLDPHYLVVRQLEQLAYLLPAEKVGRRLLRSHIVGTIPQEQYPPEDQVVGVFRAILHLIGQ